MAPRVSSVVRMVNRTASKNLEAFVEAGRHSSGFGEVAFDDAVWAIKIAKASRPWGGSEGTLAFTVEPTEHCSGERSGRPFQEPFGSFIKALVRLEEQARHKLPGGHRTAIATARFLYRASEGIGHDPCAMAASTFEQAEMLLKAAIIQGDYTPRSAYRMGIILERIARTMAEAGISERRINFTNSLPRIRDLRSRNTEDDRMPTEEVLRALFVVSGSDLHDRDRLRIRLIELLWCAPWRINEVLRLNADCEVRESKTVNGVQVLDGANKPVMNYAIRYSGSKGASSDLKWIPTAMVSVAERAIREIKEITAESRKICLWMEANPGRVWLPEPWLGAPRDTLLSSGEAAAALGKIGNIHFTRLAVALGIRPVAAYQGAGRQLEFRLGDIEDGLLRRMKPIQGDMKRSEYLFLAPRNFFDPIKTTIAPLVDLVPDHSIFDFLVTKKGTKSIFERLDLRDENGQPFRLRSHQLRHFLNTMAAENGLGEYERARWSGRSDIAQNDAYDHETGYELAERARKMLADDRMRGPIAITFDRLPPVERSAFSLVQLATVHTTDIGLCFHDWGAAPCPHHGACASCRDCAIVKGDPVHRARIEILLDEEQITLDRALAEVDDGTYGASNFVEHGRRMIAGYRNMLAIHDDPSIEDGTMVQLDPPPAREGLLEDPENGRPEAAH